MKNHLAHYPISQVCQSLDISRSGYYAWLKRPIKPTALCEYFKKQYQWHKARLGASSLVHDVRDNGYLVSERTINRVLQQLCLLSKAARKFKYKMDNSRYHDVVINTLDRAFNTDNPNVVWVTDITYIKTGEGWLYLICMDVKCLQDKPVIILTVLQCAMSYNKRYFDVTFPKLC